MQSTEFKLLRLFYYILWKYLGGQSGTSAETPSCAQRKQTYQPPNPKRAIMRLTVSEEVNVEREGAFRFPSPATQNHTQMLQEVR